MHILSSATEQVKHKWIQQCKSNPVSALTVYTSIHIYVSVQTHMLTLELPRGEPRKQILRHERLKLMERRERKAFSTEGTVTIEYVFNECQLWTENYVL